MKRSCVRFLATIMCLGISGYTFADNYIGANIGQSSQDLCDDLSVASCDDTDTGLRFYGGYEINKSFALEAGYSDLGETVASSGGITLTAEASAFTVTGKGSIPLNEQLSAFGRLGIAFWDAEVSATGFGSESDTGTDLTVAAGAQFSLNDKFGIRAEWERVDLDGDGVDLFSIGGVINF